METLVKIILSVLVGTILVLLFTFPLLWLWNWLMPTIFGLTKITFWQALGLSFSASQLNLLLYFWCGYGISAL